MKEIIIEELSFSSFYLFLFGSIVASMGGWLFVNIPLYFFDKEEMEEEMGGLEHGGAFIGIFERIIVVLLVYVQAYNAIALVLAAKSIARFSRLDERLVAEYYLIGTFSSLAFSIACGLTVISVTGPI